MYNIPSYKIIATFVCLLLFVSVNAQYNITDNDAKNAQRGYSFGLHFGLTQHSYRVEHSDNFLQQGRILSVEGDRNMGIDVGLIGVLHPVKNVEVRFVPSLNFSTRNITYGLARPEEPNIQKLEYSSFDAPLYVKYKSKPYNEMRMFAIAGGKYSMDLSSNKEERNTDDVVKLEKNNAYIELGAGAEFHFELFTLAPELKVSQGFLNQRVQNDALDLSAVLSGLYSRVYSLALNIE